MSDDEGEFEPLIRDVICKSNGGPYDDSALTAGIYLGEVHEYMRRGENLTKYVQPGIVPQVDLLSMHYGYTMTSEPWDEFPDEWTLVTLTKGVA